MRRLNVVSLMCVAACGSSSAEPIDPVAEAYCAACSELGSCERVVNEALMGACPDETSAYYVCVTDSACDESACEAEWAARNLCMGQAPVDQVRASIALLAPSANLGHRGTGTTTEGNPYPENSISSFLAAMEEGADGVSIDVEMTMDGELVIMHDDTLDRTTDCTGCVSEMTLDEIRACRLLDANENPTEEHPPTPFEVYTALDGNILIDLELKVFDSACLTDTTGPEQLVPAVLEEVTRLEGQDRTLFSSFDETVAELIKTEQPGYYSALLSSNPGPELVDKALLLGQDAIHPLYSISADTVQSALDEGLQVNIWTVDTAELMQAQIDKGSTAIITDEPEVLADLLMMAL
jgi:glycerophosphoryl diester phosphodiesterase